MIRCLNTTNHHTARIKIVDKDFERDFGFKDIKFSLKLEISTNMKKGKLSALTLWVKKTLKNIQSICQRMLPEDMLICY